MRKINVMIILLVGFILLINDNTSFGEEIRIFGNNNKRPKIYFHNGKNKGILVDIMRYVESQTNYTFKIKLYPWKRAYHQALQGKGGIIGLSKNIERLKIFDYSDVMFYDEIMLVVLKGNEFHYNGVEDLKGKKVGSQRGSSYGDKFERGKKSIFKYQPDNSSMSRLRKLLLKLGCLKNNMPIVRHYLTIKSI